MKKKMKNKLNSPGKLNVSGFIDQQETIEEQL